MDGFRMWSFLFKEQNDRALENDKNRLRYEIWRNERMNAQKSLAYVPLSFRVEAHRSEKSINMLKIGLTEDFASRLNE
ncbi:MAG: hypothetical protein ABJF11_03935 [Reichenbachiella sp.]|uniref:hypothetical protein n=1 Tax=Reichenbachiella sp. TaxID=2184521 RepID=UPI003266F208